MRFVEKYTKLTTGDIKVGDILLHSDGRYYMVGQDSLEGESRYLLVDLGSGKVRKCYSDMDIINQKYKLKCRNIDTRLVLESIVLEVN